MKRSSFIPFFVMALGGLVAGSSSAATAGPELVGAPKCMVCHKAKTGDQWKIWSESKHAGAFATLASPEALKIAAAQGLGDPQQEAACLNCHTTGGFLGPETVVSANGNYDPAEGVGCEACHGPGSAYKAKKVMEDPVAAKEAGLSMDKSATACIRCHNEGSPTFKGFDFEKSWAEVAHPVPTVE
jgi:formate-dependent nitrite reductase cytochrome c552 subunit